MVGNRRSRSVTRRGLRWASERNSPDSIVVNMSGKRFNERVDAPGCRGLPSACTAGKYGQGEGPARTCQALAQIFDQQVP